MTTFKDLNLAPEIQRALDELGFTEPTEIQKKALPLLMSVEKIDFHGQAQTGTGKTLAFGIPLLQRISKEKKAPQALVVAPTRELAVQIGESLAQVAKHVGVTLEVIYGGVSMEDQVRRLKRGVQVIIGTPGRLNDHLRRKTLSLKEVRTLVLDEADIMLDMGFKEEIDEILTSLPRDREIWLFSATVKQGISDLMKDHMVDPVSVRVSKQQVTTQNTKQYFCIVPFRSRLQALSRIIESIPDFYGFVFCQTKILTSDIAEQLIKLGYNVGALHGDMSQAQRNAVIKKFKQQELTILVATDVAARGIDVPNLTHVINYSIPEDLESYVHRIGRTGRAGKQGIGITFISKTERRIVQQIERKFHVVIDPIDVPSLDQIVQSRLKNAEQYLQSLIPAKDNLKYYNRIAPLIDSFTPDQLRNAVAHLVYDKFLSTVSAEEIPFTHVERQDTYRDEQFQEIFISVGSDDGVTKEDIRDFILQSGAINEENILTIRVIKRRSFIKLSGDCSPELMNALRGKELGGRRVHVNLTCLVGDGGRPDRRSGSRDDGGGYSRPRGGSDRRRGGDRDRGGDRGGERRRYRS